MWCLSTASSDTKAFERQIEKKLGTVPNYEVATFLRTGAEVEGILNHGPFQTSDLDSAGALNTAFLRDSLGGKSVQKLMPLRTKMDQFHVHRREIYWLCRKGRSESTL